VLRKRGNLSTPTKRLGLRISETSQIASCYVICSAFSAIDIALSALRQDNWVGEIGQRLTLDYREPSVPCGGFRDGLRTALSFSMTNPFPHKAIQAGMQKYTRIDVPILAIYALPHERGITDPAKRAEADARDLAFQGSMAKTFEKGLPSARVVWLAHADHYVFRSNEADVIREMNTFIAGFPVKSPAVHQN